MTKAIESTTKVRKGQTPRARGSTIRIARMRNRDQGGREGITMMMRRKERERLILMGLVLVMRVYMSRKVVEEDSREAIRLPHHKKLLDKNCLEWLDCRILLNRKVY